jgi:hypothetical protein
MQQQFDQLKTRMIGYGQVKVNCGLNRHKEWFQQKVNQLMFNLS